MMKQLAASGVTMATTDTNRLIIAQLDERIKKLETLIADEESRTYFVDLAKRTLSDASNFYSSSPPRLPEFMVALSISERLVQRAETAVSKHGPNLKIIGT
jgi:hypothetical protein